MLQPGEHIIQLRSVIQKVLFCRCQLCQHVLQIHIILRAPGFFPQIQCAQNIREIIIRCILCSGDGRAGNNIRQDVAHLWYAVGLCLTVRQSSQNLGQVGTFAFCLIWCDSRKIIQKRRKIIRFCIGCGFRLLRRQFVQNCTRQIPIV